MEELIDELETIPDFFTYFNKPTKIDYIKEDSKGLWQGF